MLPNKCYNLTINHVPFSFDRYHCLLLKKAYNFEIVGPSNKYFFIISLVLTGSNNISKFFSRFFTS